MADVYNMRALSTFYGTGGYIVKGQDFFTTNKNLADFYVKQGKAIYTDGNTLSNPEDQDVKVYTKNSGYVASEQNVFKTSEIERNVTSLANPVNLKISVEGMNPEDLTVEVVRNNEVTYETQTISQPSNQQSQQPSNQQSFQPSYQHQQDQPQTVNEQPNNKDLGEQGSIQQQRTSGFDVNPSEKSQGNNGGQASTSNVSNEQIQHLQEEHHKQMEALRRLEQQIQELSSGQVSSQSFEQQSEYPVEGSAQNPVFEIRHVGGGWYDLPDGTRVQGKQNAEMRARELANVRTHQQGQIPQSESNQERQFTPNQERVRQANTPVEDGASLNQSVLTNPSVGGQVGAQANQSGDQRGWNAQVQPRNSEGEFVETSGNVGQGASGIGGSTGTGGTGGGTTGGASTSGNTGGSGTGGTGGGNSGPNSGSGGGASTSGNTGQ